MSKSSNPQIQKYMDEIEAIDPADNSLEAKLSEIAQKIAEEQRKVKSVISGAIHDKALIDPADEFACEGCQ